MEWSDRMNAAVSYIEENLDGELDYNQAAQKACCSMFHFQRMFLIIMGYTPAEYVRKRRLTLAARELIATDKKVIDIALKYGYDSPDSFTRAFRNVHGITPQAARVSGAKLAAFPRISFKIELKGDTDMDYRITDKKGFDIAVVKRPFSTSGGQNFVKIPQFWQEFMKTPDYGALCALGGGKPGTVTGGGCLGICIEPNEPIKDVNNYTFDYGIAVELPAKAGSGKFERYSVPAATWAVFDCTIDNLQEVTKKIFSEWFPATGYEHAMAPELEIYLPEDPRSKVMQCQIWIPVIKKPKTKK
jgi:AraC family transcriptional regulator